MVSISIWLTAAVLYFAFYAWYVGFQGRLTPAEIDELCRKFQAVDPQRAPAFRRILEEDTGREFCMVNVIKLREKDGSRSHSRKVLAKYQKPFVGALLRRAGHPIAFASAASPSIELWGIENAEHWDFAAFMRYRSRRDMAELVVSPAFQDNHQFKLEGIEKTFAFVGDPARILVGGPKLLVPVALVALAAVLTLLCG